MIQRQLIASLTRAARSTLSCRPINIYYRQSFSTSSCIRSDDSFQGFPEAFRKSSVVKKLANNPEAINSLMELLKMLENEGIDMKSGKKPSPLAMMGLLRNAKLREQMKDVADRMKAADIDFTSKEVMDELFSLQQTQKPAESLEKSEKPSRWWR